jgi:small subunit ribosomal protein S15
MSSQNYQETLNMLNGDSSQHFVGVIDSRSNTNDDNSRDYTDEDFQELYEDSLDFVVDEALLAKLKDDEAMRLATRGKLQEEINHEKVTAAIAKWRKHDSDVGSAAVQVAIFHERVLYLTQHMLRNRKDNAAKRGLQQLVIERRKMLDYLYKTDLETAQRLINELGIRYRAPGRFWDKQVKYGRFKNTRQVPRPICNSSKSGSMKVGTQQRDSFVKN